MEDEEYVTSQNLSNLKNPMKNCIALVYICIKDSTSKFNSILETLFFFLQKKNRDPILVSLFH